MVIAGGFAYCLLIGFSPHRLRVVGPIRSRSATGLRIILTRIDRRGHGCPAVSRKNLRIIEK
jgi:hypothetical protein